jgi:hypothetical protein
MQRAAKLTLKEFALAFNNCKPPTGWGKKIGGFLQFQPYMQPDRIFGQLLHTPEE